MLRLIIFLDEIFLLSNRGFKKILKHRYVVEIETRSKKLGKIQQKCVADNVCRYARTNMNVNKRGTEGDMSSTFESEGDCHPLPFQES